MVIVHARVLRRAPRLAGGTDPDISVCAAKIDFNFESISERVHFLGFGCHWESMAHRERTFADLIGVEPKRPKLRAERKAEARRANDRDRKARWRAANRERSRKLDRMQKRRQRARERQELAAKRLLLTLWGVTA
ncbi:MAG TPA: hypothetical protein VG735_14755 [Caulobacterales bacterium]|nr:hypothetical protein [Caulobacterales bacterium]